MSNTFKGTPSRRAFLKMSAAAGLASFAGPLAALDVPTVAGLPAANGPLHWLDSGGQKGEFIKATLPEFGKVNGFDVVYDGLPWNEIGTILPLGIRNGSAPDTFNLPQGMEPSVALAEGWIQPYDDYFADIAAFKAAYPAGSFVEGVNVFGGKTYGFPFSTERRFNNALLFDRAKLAEAGYDKIGPELALTYDEMRDAAKKITENSGGRSFGFIIGGNQLGRWGDSVTMLAQRAGAKVGNSALIQGLDFATGEYAFGSDEYVAAVELLLAMRDDGSVFPGVLTINAPQAREFITQGAAGMIIQGPWNVPIWEATAPQFDFGVSPGPVPTADQQNNPVYVAQLPNTGNMMWLNKAAKNPHQAAAYFAWLGSLDGQVAYANVASCADPAIFPETIALADLSERAVQMLNMAERLVRIAPNPMIANPDLSKVAAAYVDPTPNLSQAIQGLFAGQLTDVRKTLTGVADARNKALDDAIAVAKAAGANVSREDFAFAAWDSSRDFTNDDYAAL